MSVSPWIRVGAVSAALSVAAGAFGAHALRDRLNEAMRATYLTAASYQMYHALALVAVGLLAGATARPGRAIAAAGWAFLLGTLLFSGSLYALALTGVRMFGAITPLGGVGFLIGWVLLAVAGPSTGKSAGPPTGV